MTAQSILLIEWGGKFATFVKERDMEIAIQQRMEDERLIMVRSGPQTAHG